MRHNYIRQTLSAAALLTSILGGINARAQFTQLHNVSDANAVGHELVQGTPSYIRTNSYGDWSVTSIKGAESNDILLTNINSTTGAVLGNYTIGTADFDEYAYSLIEAKNGKLILVGKTDNTVNGDYDNLLVLYDIATNSIDWSRAIGLATEDESCLLIQSITSGANSEYFIAGGTYEGTDNNLQFLKFDISLGYPSFSVHMYYDEGFMGQEFIETVPTSMISNGSSVIVAGHAQTHENGARLLFTTEVSYYLASLGSTDIKYYSIDGLKKYETYPSIDRSGDGTTFGMSFTVFDPSSGEQTIGVAQLKDDRTINWCGDFKVDNGDKAQRPVRLVIDHREYDNYKIGIYDGNHLVNSGRPGLITIRPNGSPLWARWYALHVNNTQYMLRDDFGHYVFRTDMSESADSEEVSAFSTLTDQTLPGYCSGLYNPISRKGMQFYDFDLTSDIEDMSTEFPLVLNLEVLPMPIASFDFCENVDSGGWGKKETANSVVEVYEENRLTVYPNPSSGNYQVEVNADNYQIEVIDVLGKRILTQQASSRTTQIDLSPFLDGMYTLSIKYGDKIETKKLIKN